MYLFIRLILGIILYVACCIFIKKKREQISKTIKSLIAWGCVAITVVLTFIPFENAFVSFETSSEAFAYCFTTNPDINGIGKSLNGNFVVGGNFGNEIKIIFPANKSGSGFKLPWLFESKKVASSESGLNKVKVYRYKNTEDYYVYVSGVSSVESIEESDTKKYNLYSSFSIKDDGQGNGFESLNLSGIFKVYCTYIHSPKEIYTVTVNDVDISVYIP